MITVYTCIAGNYDVLVPQPKFSNVQYICFAETDKTYNYGNWIVKPFVSPKDLKNNALINRFHKILSYKNFQEGEFSIYIDGNVQLKINPERYVKILDKENASIAAFKHPQRKSISEEFQACLDQKKILIYQQMSGIQSVMGWCLQQKKNTLRMFWVDHILFPMHV